MLEKLLWDEAYTVRVKKHDQKKSLWSLAEVFQWSFWYAILNHHHLSPLWVVEYKKGLKDDSPGTLRSPSWGYNHSPALSKSGQWIISRWALKKLLKKTHNGELTLCMIYGEFNTPNSLMEDYCLFRISYILEMSLVIVIFQSWANRRLICLQP